MVSSVFAGLLVVLSFWLGRRAAREDLRRERAVQLADAVGRFTTAVAVRSQSDTGERTNGFYNILRIAGRIAAAYQKKHTDFTAWLIEHIRAVQLFLAERGSPVDLPDPEYEALLGDLGSLQGEVEVWADSPRTWQNKPRSPIQLPGSGLDLRGGQSQDG